MVVWHNAAHSATAAAGVTVIAIEEKHYYPLHSGIMVSMVISATYDWHFNQKNSDIDKANLSFRKCET